MMFIFPLQHEHHEPQAAPVNVLSGEGLFSCLCLPLHQAHVVVTGTAEGCLLLWDLREPASLSRSVVGVQQGQSSG